MTDPKIEWDGMHVIARNDGVERRLLDQAIHAELGADGVTYLVRSNHTGNERTLHITDPAAVLAMHEIDREQRNVELLDNPVPDPDREPVGEIPPGRRPCWLCNATGMAEDEWGLCECANCHGKGHVSAHDGI